MGITEGDVERVRFVRADGEVIDLPVTGLAICLSADALRLDVPDPPLSPEDRYR